MFMLDEKCMGYRNFNRIVTSNLILLQIKYICNRIRFNKCFIKNITFFLIEYFKK